MKYYKGNITPEKNTIFVFGSNSEGRHGAGSAKVAVRQFGAKLGQGHGLQGNAYGLVTTDLSVSYRPSVSRKDIVMNIIALFHCAEDNKNKEFKIAYRNNLDEKTLCGYTGRQLIECFKSAERGYGCIPDNIVISEEWYKNWDNI